MHTLERGRDARRLALPLLAVCLGVAACTPLEAKESLAAPAAGPVPSDLPKSPSAARGERPYKNWCVGCHGPEGLGDGPATAYLDPLPRNLQAGRFKFRSTPSGELPTRDDLVRTITRGLKGSSMPAFPLLPETERQDLAEYVLHLAQYGRLKVEAQSLLDDGVPMETVRAEKMGEIRKVLADRSARAQPVGVPPETESGGASVARGKKIYTELCESCHGATGVGDGPSAYALRDGRDAPIRPRDFTTGVLRGGDTPQDIYRRLRTGLDGTPMPAFDSRSDQDLWDIVHFVMTLRSSGGGEQVR